MLNTEINGDFLTAITHFSMPSWFPPAGGRLKANNIFNLGVSIIKIKLAQCTSILK